MRPLLGSLILVVILTACGKKSPEATQEVTTRIPTAVPTHLVIWYSDPTLSDALASLGAAFEEKYPAVDTELTLQEPQTFREIIGAAFDSGTGPDLIIAPADILAWLLSRHELTPIESPTMRQLATFTQPEAFQAMMDNDVMMGFPLVLDTPVLYVNTTLLDGELDSFDAFVQAASTIGAVVQPDFLLTSDWLQVGNFTRPINPAGELEITYVEFSEYLNRLLQLRQTPQITFTTDSTAFVNGEVGLYVGSSREATALKTALGEALGIQPLLLKPELGSYYLANPTVMMISLNAVDANVNAGKTFIEFAVQTDQQTTLSHLTGFPPMSYSATDDPLLQQIVSQTQELMMVPVDSPFYEVTLPTYNNAVAQVLSGALTPEEAAQTIFPPVEETAP